MKRLLSLALSLVLVLSLFAGFAGSVRADGEIGQFFDRYLTGDKIDELFDEENVVQSGSCGRTVNDVQQANVLYKIYKIDQEKLNELKSEANSVGQSDLFQKLRDLYPDFNVNGENLLPDMQFNLLEDQDYYALKLYGSGEMADYSFTQRAPWNGHITVDGEDVDMEKQIIAAYVEGEHANYTGVTNIGERAFFGMDGLMLVYLGETVKSIGDKAFETCDALSAINFPSNLESLGRRAFYACDYLTFVRLNTCTKLTKIEERTFCTCSHLTEIALPPNVVEIGDFAFAWDHTLGTNRFDLPDKLKTIGKGAFAFCTHLGIVEDITIPASTTNIGEWAFACCFDLGRAKGGINIMDAEQALTIGNGAFAGCASLQEITFPNRVAFINNYAFAACDKLKQVSFGDRDGTDTLHIRRIGDRAFDSLESTGLTAFHAVADAFKEVGSGEQEYIDGSSSAAEAISGEAYDLSGVTPLKYAAFGGYPPSKEATEPVVEAKSNKHSFPRDVTIWYPSPEYNNDAYGQWRSKGNVIPGNPMSTWYGYNCEPMWVGHFHEFDEPVIRERTCTEDGTESKTCHVWQDGKPCGYTEVTITEKATGHKDEMIQAEDPDCLNDGVAYYHCSNPWCDHPDHSEILPALGHDYENLQDYTAPTCTEDGYARGTCSRCGEKIDTVLPAKGHNTTYMTVGKEPTCTEEGYYKGNCPDCGRRNVRQPIPALGHDWDQGTIIRPATQTTDGLMRYTCARCGEINDEIIPKTMHVHDYKVTVVAPTCTTEGYTNHKCACGDEYNDNFVRPAHKWDKGTVSKAPTATTEGSMKYTCTVCGTYRYETIPATGEKPTGFVDVEKGSYYEAAVNWAVNHKPQITKGTDETHFSPDANCTRAQAVTFLYRAAGEPAVSGVNPFVDVHAGDYFYNAVRWAVKNGITTGTDANHFSPDEPCTRAHIVTFLWRWKQQPTVTTNRIPFRDVDAGEWYTLPVLWASEKNVTNGMGDGLFGTELTCTRAQIVTFLQRAENLK